MATHAAGRRHPAAALPIPALCLAALLLAAAPARADLTAAQVWQDWQRLSASYGQSIDAGSEEVADGALTVRDVVVGMEFAEGSMSATIGQIVFAEQDDGTVRVTPSDEYRMIFVLRPAAGAKSDFHVSLRQRGLEVVARGADGVTGYAYRADEVVATLTEAVIGGAPQPGAAILTATGLDGSTSLGAEGARTTYESRGGIDAVAFKLDASEPAGDATLRVVASLSDIAASGAGTLVPEPDFEDPAALLAAGFRVGNEVTFGAASFVVDFAEGADTAHGSGRAGGGTLSFALSPERLRYGAEVRGLDLTLDATGMPLPVMSAAADALAFGAAMPSTRSEAPGDFALNTAIRGLTLSEAIWGLFDPAGVLPRDPATLAVDLTGTGRWLIDILDPEAAADPSVVPVEVHSLAVDDLEVSGAGAALTGTGAFTFDNTDVRSFDGLPRPEGQLDLQLTGASALLDRLVTLGLLAEDQALGARMMLGIFARPGEGEDTLTSTLRVTPEGRVFANDMPLR